MLNHQTRTFSRANTPMGIFVNVAPLPVRRQQAINIANVSSAKSGWSLCNKLAPKCLEILNQSSPNIAEIHRDFLPSLLPGHILRWEKRGRKKLITFLAMPSPLEPAS